MRAPNGRVHWTALPLIVAVCGVAAAAEDGGRYDAPPSCTAYSADAGNSVHTARGARSILTVQEAYAVSRVEVQLELEGTASLVGREGPWADSTRPLTVSLSAASVDRVASAILAEPDLAMEFPPANASVVDVPAIFVDGAEGRSAASAPLEPLSLFAAGEGTVRHGTDGALVVKGAGWGGSRGLWVLEVEMPPALLDRATDDVTDQTGHLAVAIKQWTLVLCETPQVALEALASPQNDDGGDAESDTNGGDGGGTGAQEDGEIGTCAAEDAECTATVAEALEEFPGAMDDDNEATPDEIEGAIDDLLFSPPAPEDVGFDGGASPLRVMSAEQSEQEWMPVPSSGAAAPPFQPSPQELALAEGLRNLPHAPPASLPPPQQEDGHPILHDDGALGTLSVSTPATSTEQQPFTWPLPSADALRNIVAQMQERAQSMQQEQASLVNAYSLETGGGDALEPTSSSTGTSPDKQILPTLNGGGGGGAPILPLLREVSNQYTDYTASQSGVLRSALSNVLRVYIPPIGPLLSTAGLIAWGSAKVKEALTPGPKKCVAAPFALNTLRVVNSLNDTLDCDEDFEADSVRARRGFFGPAGGFGGGIDKYFNGFFARRRRVCGDAGTFGNLPFLAFKVFWNPFALLPFGLTGVFRPFLGVVDPVLGEDGVEDVRFYFGKTGMFESKLLKKGDYYFRYKGMTNSSFAMKETSNNMFDRYAYEMYKRHRNGTLASRFLHRSVRTTKLTVDWPGTNFTEATTRDGKDALKLDFSRLHKKATGKYLDPERVKILAIWDRRDYFCRPAPTPKKLLFRLQLVDNSAGNSTENPGACNDCASVCGVATNNAIISSKNGFDISPMQCTGTPPSSLARMVAEDYLSLLMADVLNSCAFDGPPPVFTSIVTADDIKVRAASEDCNPTFGYDVAVRYASGLFDKQKAFLLGPECLGNAQKVNNIINKLWTPASNPVPANATRSTIPNICSVRDVSDEIFVRYVPKDNSTNSNSTNSTFVEHLNDLQSLHPYDDLSQFGKTSGIPGRRRSLLDDSGVNYEQTWFPFGESGDRALSSSADSTYETFVSAHHLDATTKVYGIPLYAAEKFLDNTGPVQQPDGIQAEFDPFTMAGKIDYKPRFGFECFYPHEKYIREDVLGNGNKGLRWYPGYGQIFPGYKPYANQFKDPEHARHFRREKDSHHFYGKYRALYDANHTRIPDKELGNTTFGYPWVPKTKSGKFTGFVNHTRVNVTNGTNVTIIRPLNKYDRVKRNFRGAGFARRPFGLTTPFAFDGPTRAIFPTKGRLRAPFPFVPAPTLRKQWLKNFKTPYIPAYYPLQRGLGMDGMPVNKSNVTGEVDPLVPPKFTDDLTGLYFPGYRTTAFKNAIYSPEFRPSRAFVIEEGIVVDVAIVDPKKGFAKSMELARASTEKGFCSAPGPAWFDETKPFAFGGLFAFLYPNLAGTFLDPTIGRDLAGPFFPNLRSFFQSRPYGGLPFFRPGLFYGISRDVAPTNSVPVYRNVNVTTDDRVVTQRLFSGVYQDVPCNTTFCNGTATFTKGVSFQKGRVLDVTNTRITPGSHATDSGDKYDSLFKTYNPDTMNVHAVSCKANSALCKSLAWHSDDESPFRRFDDKEKTLDQIKEEMRNAASTSVLLGDRGSFDNLNTGKVGGPFGDSSRYGYGAKLLRLPFVVNLPFIGPFFAWPGPFLPARFGFRAGIAFFSRLFYPAGACPFPCVSSLVVITNSTGGLVRRVRCIDPDNGEICPFGFGI